MTPQEYTCARCGETYESGWSEEEMLEEKTQLFGDVSKEECEVLCDNCFKYLIGKYGFDTEVQ